MMLTSLFVLLFISCAKADATTTEEVPFVVAAKDDSDVEKVSSLLPELDVPLTHEPANRGRSDIEIEDEQPFVGYFYPKPDTPFNLPAFKTVKPDASIASFAGEDNFEEVDRSARSPRRRPPYHRPGYLPPSNNNVPPFIPGFIPPSNNNVPPFRPGFIPPSQIRPLPALYGQGYH